MISLVKIFYFIETNYNCINKCTYNATVEKLCAYIG